MVLRRDRWGSRLDKHDLDARQYTDTRLVSVAMATTMPPHARSTTHTLESVPSKAWTICWW